MGIRYRTGHAAAGLLLAAMSSHTLAQGLGEITLESSLNEPLRASIQLLDTDNLDATQIQVALATQEDFAARGVDRNFLLNSLRFEVIKGEDGNDRINVTSTDKIDEPYLTFLVSVVWPNGRNLREYTLLLDLPGNNDGASVSPPQLNNPVGNRVPAGTSTDTAAANTSDGYTVQQGDTLYQIAEQTRPSQDVSVQQMMVALQRANEDAFVNNNINRILTGRVLRIPTAAEIALIDQAAASAQVAQQNQELMSQPLAVNDSAGNAGAPPRDELTLLSGDQATTGGSSDLAATIAALENELMLSEENLDRARLENLELTNRLAALQEQIDLLQNIIAIEDERIAQLQAELSQQSAATEQALSEASSAAAGSASGLVGLLRNGVVAIGGLLAVALAAAGLLYVKRRRIEAMTQEENVALTEIDDSPAGGERPGLAAMLATLMARFRRSDNDEAAVDEDSDAAVASRIEPVMAAAATPAPAAAAVAASPRDTNALLDEMGLGEEFRELHDVLDDVDRDVPEASDPPAAVSEAGTGAGTAAPVAEADLLAQALDEAEEQAADDFLAAPATTTASTPESFAFTTEPAPAVAESSTEAEKPEVFEFTLPGLDEAPAAEAPVADETPVETFSFSPGALAAAAEPPASAAVEDALEVLSFDENSVTLDEGGAEEGYTPAAAGQEAHDARLDLAVAYEAMGDIDGAIEILDEVIASGRPAQAAEAQRLKQKWQHS